MTQCGVPVLDGNAEHRDGVDVSGWPLRERRAQLEDSLPAVTWCSPVRRLPPTGLEAWAVVLEKGYGPSLGRHGTSRGGRPTRR
jgi:hypothetical protein